MSSKINQIILIILEHLYCHSKHESKVNTFAISKLAKIGNTFDVWKKIFERLDDKRMPRGLFAILKMEKLAKTFDHWFIINTYCDEGSELGMFSISKMEELGTFADWMHVCFTTDEESMLNSFALSKVEELGDLLRFANYSYNEGSRLEELVVSKFRERMN